MREKGSVPIIVILVLAILGAFVAGNFYANSQSRDLSLNSEIQQLKQELTSKEEEISYLLQNKGKARKQSTTVYDFSKLGIYSPLLQNKEVLNQPFDYRRQTITQKILGLETDGQSNLMELEVWELTSASAPNTGLNTKDFAVIDGYGATSVTDIQKEWNESDSFTNTHDLKFHWVYSPAAKAQIGAVRLEALPSSNNASGHPIFIRIRHCCTSANSASESIVVNAKNKLKKFADTLSLQKY